MKLQKIIINQELLKQERLVPNKKRKLKKEIN